MRPLHQRALEADDVLEALPGLNYVTDADGLLLACSRRAWTRFARRNEGASIADPEAVLGRSIYTAMNTERTRQVHRRIADGVLAGDLISYRWCCDGPDVQRDMRMTIRALRLLDDRDGLLYHSRTLALRYRIDGRERTAGGTIRHPVHRRRPHCGTYVACAASATTPVRRSAAPLRRRPGNTRQTEPLHVALAYRPIASHTASASTAGRTWTLADTVPAFVSQIHAMPERVRFAILADAHVLPDGAPPLHGIDSGGNLRAAIGRVSALAPPAAFVMHLGDLVGEETVQAYGAFTAIAGALNLPQYPVLGNHDDPELLAEALPVPEGVVPAGAPDGHYSFTQGPLHIAVLNSRVAGEIGGRLDAAQLDWLDDDLRAHHGATALVFVHHPPASIGIEWLDASPLSNAAELAVVIKRSGSVAMVFAGHVHRHERATSGGLSVETAPSTWTSFQANPDEPRLDTGQGFLVVDAGPRRLLVRRVVL